MRTFQYDAASFRHIIAAPDPQAARTFVVANIRDGQGGIVPLVELCSPDPLTRRAAESATKPTEIDLIPLYWVERPGDFPLLVDHDGLPAQLSPEEAAALRTVSPVHREWLDAYAEPALYAAIVALESSPSPIQQRALAAAFGCGPLPAWLAPIAPAVIALESEAEARGFSAELDCALERNWLALSTWLDRVTAWGRDSDAWDVYHAAHDVRDAITGAWPADSVVRSALRSIGWI